MFNYTHLSLAERKRLYLLQKQGQSIRQIAKHMGRSPSTISRELKRNSHTPTDQVLALPDKSSKSIHCEYYASATSFYEPLTAQELYRLRSQNSHKPHKINADLADYIISRLRGGISPELLCGRLHLETGIKIHHETVYRMIYSNRFAHLRLWEYLTKAHKKRKNRHKRQGGRHHIPFRISIHQRPDNTNNRTEFGHYEGDTVLSSRQGSGGIQTQVERVSRYIFARKVQAVNSAEGIKVAIDIFKSLPPTARKSTTFDNGMEFAKHYELKKRLDMDTYFADPYSAYQRGTNEHANGKLRRFFPKGTDFDVIHAQDLQEVVDFYNNRPMKCLRFKTPAEVFASELKKSCGR